MPEHCRGLRAPTLPCHGPEGGWTNRAALFVCRDTGSGCQELAQAAAGQHLGPSLQPGRGWDRSQGGTCSASPQQRQAEARSWAGLGRHLRGSKGSEVVAVVQEQFALLQKAVGDAVPSVHRLHPLAQAAQLVAQGHEHVEDAPVCGVVAVVVLVALHLHGGKWQC